MTVRPGIVFLDRDGTLIETSVVGGTPVAENDPTSVILLPGVEQGCAALRAAGHRLVMVTNQPDVSRGRALRDNVEAINNCLVDVLDLDLALTCYHDDSDACACRKPQPGLLIEGARALGVDLDASSVIVGDRWRDIRAGENAGITSVLVGNGYGETEPCDPDVAVSDFSAAVTWILTTERNQQ